MDDTFLSPIEKPRGLVKKLVYAMTRKQFGKVPTPAKVHSARLPTAFGMFYAKISALDKKVSPSTFKRLPSYYSEREICEIVWLVATEHVYNMTNLGLNIHSDMLCDASRKANPRSSAAQAVSADSTRTQTSVLGRNGKAGNTRRHSTDAVDSSPDLAVILCSESALRSKPRSVWVKG